MEIGKEYLASGLDSFPFLCYHALFLPILLICLSIRARSSSLTSHSFDLPLSFARSSLNKTSLTNLTSFFLYHPSKYIPEKNAYTTTERSK